MVSIGPGLAARTHDSPDSTSEETVPRSVLRPTAQRIRTLHIASFEMLQATECPQGAKVRDTVLFPYICRNRRTVAPLHAGTLGIAASHNFSSFPSP